MAVEVLAVNEKPSFTADQIISATDVQRRWKSQVEDKLTDLPYLVLLSGKSPRVVIMDYDKFEALWRKVESLSEDLLGLESLNRLLSAKLSGKKLTSMKELMAKAGITAEDLERLPDVELEHARDPR